MQYDNCKTYMVFKRNQKKIISCMYIINVATHETMASRVGHKSHILRVPEPRLLVPAFGYT